MNEIEKLQRERFLFLKLLWEATKGNEDTIVAPFDVGKELGFPNEKTISIVNYLAQERLIGRWRIHIRILHEGNKAVEAALSVPFQPTTYFPNSNILSEDITEMKDTSKENTVFVVHGRNLKARDALFSFLRAIELHPLEWEQAVKLTGKPSPYIGEILTTAFDSAQAIIVLMTPDDIAYLREYLREPHDPPHETEPTPQVRPNVLFEAGMAVGRSEDRTILIEFGNVRPFSDIAGRHIIKMNDSPAKRNELAQRLETTGCAINLSGKDWLKEGIFNIANMGIEIKKDIAPPPKGGSTRIFGALGVQEHVNGKPNDNNGDLLFGLGNHVGMMRWVVITDENKVQMINVFDRALSIVETLNLTSVAGKAISEFLQAKQTMDRSWNFTKSAVEKIQHIRNLLSINIKGKFGVNSEKIFSFGFLLTNVIYMCENQETITETEYKNFIAKNLRHLRQEALALQLPHAVFDEALRILEIGKSQKERLSLYSTLVNSVGLFEQALR